MDTLKKTKIIIDKYDIRANKRYGQNFLVDDDVLNGIVGSSLMTKDDLVIEIGPGLGNLTEYILKNSKFAILVEIDKKMIDVLENRLSNFSNFILLNEDVLKINIDEEIERIEKEKNIEFKNIRVVANLPYYITTPILFKLLEDENRIDTITVMVQQEVAQRMVASPKSKEYGILTIMVDYFCDANINITVPNSSFIPSPEVTSTVITLNKRKKYDVKDEKLFFELVHKAFAQRRKKMVNSLVSNKFNNMDKEQIENLFIKCGIDLNSRAEELDIEKYVKIVNNIE